MASTNRTHAKGPGVLIQRVVFGVLAVLCLVGWFLARSAAAHADADATRAAEARTDKFATTVVAEIAVLDGNHVLVASKPFADGIGHEVGSDASVARVRVWDGTGAIVATTDPADQTSAPRPGTGYRDALRGDPSSEKADGSYTPIAGGDQAPTSLLEMYVPLRARGSTRPIGAVEIDYLSSSLVSPAVRLSPLALAAAAVVFGGLFVFSMTRGSAGQQTPALKKIAPPDTSPATVRHDFGASKRSADHGWVIAPNDAPPPSTSVAELETATTKIEELEKALRRAADENELVRSQAASQELDMERLRQEANERVAALKQQVDTEGPEVEALRAKLVDAETRATAAETLLASAHEELEAAHAQVGDTRVTDVEVEVGSPSPTDVIDAQPPIEPEGTGSTIEAAPELREVPEQDLASQAEPELASQPEAEQEPAPEPEPADPTDLIAVLEARVAEAEARADAARDEAMQLSPEASDLRVRLARTAARKKMGATTAVGDVAAEPYQ